MQNKDYTKLSFSFVIIDSHLIYKIKQENLKGKSITIIVITRPKLFSFVQNIILICLTKTCHI